MLIKTNVNSKNKRMLNPQPKVYIQKKNNKTNQLIQLNYLM